jgi:hypothetical protein
MRPWKLETSTGSRFKLYPLPRSRSIRLRVYLLCGSGWNYFAVLRPRLFPTLGHELRNPCARPADLPQVLGVIPNARPCQCTIVVRSRQGAVRFSALPKASASQPNGPRDPGRLGGCRNGRWASNSCVPMAPVVGRTRAGWAIPSCPDPLPRESPLAGRVRGRRCRWRESCLTLATDRCAGPFPGSCPKGPYPGRRVVRRLERAALASTC